MHESKNTKTSIEIYDMALIVYIISRKTIIGEVEVRFQEESEEPYYVFSSEDIDTVEELTTEFYQSGLSESFEKFYQSVREVGMAIEVAACSLK